MSKPSKLLRCALAVILACGLMIPATALTAFAENESTATPLAIDVGTAGAPAAQADGITLGDFTITGDGVTADDFELGASTLTVNTDKPFAIAGTSTKYGLVVPAGVSAHMTLAGVNINTAIAFNIFAGGSVSLVLADGTTNSFTSSNASYPGIHCGTGAMLEIDDSIPNVDVNGRAIIPAQGQIPAGTRYIANDGKEHVSVGDYLTLLDSKNPGALNVKGGGHGAGLGGAWGEDGGNMTFNGGVITVTNGDGPSVSTNNHGGAGIGGGRGAAGTSPSEWITINGGRVTATGAYHGAGIGGGYNQSVSLPAGLVQSTHPGGTGNVRINGGYTLSNGGDHGNGFGRACYGSQANCDNRDYTILITGGTMIPAGGSKLGQAMDIGGAGTKPGTGGDTVVAWAANVVISGGSVFVGGSNGKFRFDGTAYGSYTEGPDGTITPNVTNQVELITINLTQDLIDLTPEGQTPDLNRTITSWKLLVGGDEVPYGAPAQFDKGNLYLWLTPEQTAQQVTVELSYADDDGNPVPVDPLYRPAGGGDDSGNKLKRYVFFDLQPDFFTDSNGETGTAKVSYDALSAYEKEKYGDTKDENGLVTVPLVKKEYDGLPYVARELTQENPINSGGKDQVDIWESISYLCQLYDEKTGKLGTEVESEKLPSDTGLTRFTMTSLQYKDDPRYTESYYGHRAYGWCEITPVPAVVKIDEKDGSAWVRLDPATGAYEVVKEDDPEPGNRLRVAFDIRSAKGTATTCKAPTGRFQVMIDGQPVGEPVALTEEAVEASAGSSFSVVAGEEGRETTRVVYYLDPTKLDGALDVLESDNGSNVHEVTVQYLPDKNYVEGTEENDGNQDTKPTPIVPVPPTGSVVPDPDGPAIEVGPADDPEPGPGDTDPDNPTGKMTVIRRTVTASYADFHSADNADLADFFALALDSNTSSKPSYSVSNTAVATLLPAEEGKPAFGEGGAAAIDEKGRLKIQVNSCGTSVITVEQRPNALFTGIKYILTVNVLPDPALKPQVQIRLTWRNLTALAEEAASPMLLASRALETAAAAAGAPSPRVASGRAHTPPRPGDVLEYTVTGLNLTPGSAWQAAELKDAIDQRLSFDEDSVEVAPNYATRTDKSTALGSDAFYDGFDWDGLGWAEVARGTSDDDYRFDDASATLSKAIGTVYGGQSTSVRFQAEVPEDAGLGDRPAEGGKLPEITNEPDGTGGYGKPELKPGETPTDPTPLEPEDIEVIGNADPVDGKPSPVEPTPVLPKDPAAADIVTTVKVEQTGHTEEHDGDRFMVGDTLTVTVTSTNKGPDSKLSNAVVKATLPVGMEPKEGTIKLVDGRGESHDVPMGAYDPKTGVIAVNAGDLYFGDDAVLTFDVEVISTSETRQPAGPSGPGDPDDPDSPGPTRPTDPAIEGGTLGETPTDEWEREHPADPGVEPSDPADDPKPGTPFEPGRPWEDLEDELVSTPPAVDPDMPPVLPSNPKLEDDGEGPADIAVAKEAENLDSADGATHVGDVVRYTITLSNAKEHSMWYDAVIRDDVPVGLEPLSGSIRATGADGVEREVPDGAYDPAARVLAVAVGDLPGGRAATVVFDALVTEEAVGADIGNVASASGTRPSDAEPGEVAGGAPRPVPGAPFAPEGGWDAYEREHPSLSNPAPAYPAGVTEKGGVVAEPRPEPAPGAPGGDGGAGGGDGTGDGGAGSRTPIRLAQTGDELVAPSVALVMAAAAAGVMLTALMAQRSRRREELRARYAGRW